MHFLLALLALLPAAARVPADLPAWTQCDPDDAECDAASEDDGDLCSDDDCSEDD